MKNLFDSTSIEEIKSRLERLRPESERQWGKMGPAQAVAHCTVSLEMALGDFRAPQLLIGRLAGWAIKPIAFRESEPMRRNSPTIKDLVVADDRDLEVERSRLCATIDRFAAAGPAGCTEHPHSFFGRLTPEEWSMWMYKHLDHHLRQFGV